MANTLKDYQILTSGLTQQDRQFRDAIEELSESRTDFYGYRMSAYNRLNHALIGKDIDLENPVKIAGMVDYPNSRLVVSRWGQETEYNFDDLDPRYVASLNQVAVVKGKKPEKLPLTDIALEMLDDIHSDVELKPDVEEHSFASSAKVLQQAFANEMVLQVQLEEFVNEQGLMGVLDAHSDEVTELVRKKSFEASFNDGLKDLNNSVEKMAGQEIGRG